MARLDEKIDRTLAALEQEGQLNAQQRALVLERLRGDLRKDRPELAAVVASLGALLLAAGMLYLIGYNWALLGKPLKLALIFGLWLALHGAGWHLAEHPGRSPRIGRAFTLLGVLAFGGAIGLVAQIYNLSAHYPNSVLLWWVLSIPVVLVTRSRAVLMAVMSIAFVWTLWHLGVWLEDLPLDDEREWLANYALVGVSVAAVLRALAALAEGSRYEVLAPVLRSPVLGLAGLAPFVLAFHDPWYDWASWNEPQAGARMELLLQAGGRLAPSGVALALAAAVAAVASWRRGSRSVGFAWILLGMALVLALCAWLAPRLVPWLANAALFGGSLALIARAVRVHSGRLANAGIFLFVAGVLARYFEYLWDKLEGAYAFLGTGAVLMAAAWFLENRRRAFRAVMQGEPR